MPLTSTASAGTFVAVTELVIAAFNAKRTAFHQCGSQFLAGRSVNLLHGGAGNLHINAAVFLRKSLFVDETDGLVFIHGKCNYVSGITYAGWKKFFCFGKTADFSAFSGSGHGEILSARCELMAYAIY